MTPDHAEPVQTRLSPSGWIALPVAFVVALAACTSSATLETTDTTIGASVVVEPDYGADMIVVNVMLTDDGFEPSTIFIPAGPPIRLVMRNLGTTEHHFRVRGLIPADVAWYLEPDIRVEDLETMTPEQLASFGIDMSVDDPEHVVHHLAPTFVPFKETSLAGITPLRNEVHGYTQVGTSEIMSFFATNTGTFTAEDVLHPEITGRVIVFEAGS